MFRRQKLTPYPDLSTSSPYSEIGYGTSRLFSADFVEKKLINVYSINVIKHTTNGTHMARFLVATTSHFRPTSALDSSSKLHHLLIIGGCQPKQQVVEKIFILC